MQDLQKDLSLLTNVSASTWADMNKRSTSLLSHYIVEAKQDGCNTLSVDIGIGILHICSEEECVKFRFEPSKELSRKVKKSLTSNNSSLVNDIDYELGRRFSSTYKELV